MAGIIERTLPRISVNKLGEYMTATPARRRSIVRDQRRPKGFLVPRYNEAHAAVIAYLTGAERDPAVVLREAQRLRAAPPDSAWQAQRNQLCGEALAAFLEAADLLPPARYVRGAPRPPLVNYGEVAVSVRPELVLRGADRRGAPTVGALKLYFSKTAPLTAEAGGFIAAAVADFAEQALALDAAVDPKLCLALDVFARRLYRASRQRAQRRQDLIAACDEIARAWTAA
jgi:hypothetical protein